MESNSLKHRLAGLSRRLAPLRRPVTVATLVLAIALFLWWLPPGQRSEIGHAVLAQRSLMTAIALFTLLSLSLLWAAGQTLDNRVFLLVNLWGYRPKWLDNAMWVVTQLGGGWMAFLVAAGFYFGRRPSLGLEIILGTLTLALLVEGLKEIMGRARPYLINAQARVIGWRAPGRSFPSGHTSQAFFMATLLNFQLGLPLPLTIAIFGAATAVGITRMYVGAHFPRDVVAGCILGIAWGIFLILIDPYWQIWFTAF